MTRSTIPWPIRGVLGGTAGTAKMTLAYETERRLRHNHRGPLDYDDTPVPGKIVVSITHPGKVTDKEDNEVGLGLRWELRVGLRHLARPAAPAGARALVERVVRGHADERAVLDVPLLGRTPPPWRWPADMMATAIATHVAYVVAVATVDDVLGR